MADAAFVVATATVIGHAHVRTARNNQDGMALHAGPNVVVAVVTDGCSSAPFSEVGARLGARWLAEWTPHLAEHATTDEELLEAVRAGLLGFLEQSAGLVRPEKDELALAVEEFFLFTYLIAVIRPERTIVFGQGDGVVSVNGLTKAIDSGPDNAPAYPAYALVREALTVDPGPLTPVLHWAGATSDVQSLIIATDGAVELIARAEEELPEGGRAGGLEEFEVGEEVLENPAVLQQRLTLLGKHLNRLRDDTTIVLVRRGAPSAP